MEYPSHKGFFLFLRELFRNPRAVGAAIPSSPWLAECVVKQIPVTHYQDYILELGPGTGVFTTAMIKAGIQPERLILIEQSSELSHYLDEHFPLCQVIKGDARDAKTLIEDKAKDIHVVVSSLPLRLLDSNVLASIIQAIESVLSPQGIFIQYTYRWWNTHFELPSYFQQQHSHYVWRNVPPARIDVYQYNPK